MANSNELQEAEASYRKVMADLIRTAVEIVDDALPLIPMGNGENQTEDRRNLRAAAFSMVLDDMTAGPADDE
ncbi:MAG: hypothetical protein JWM19_997 [Actinomycetia bacterium]|nr:hypothetical protein [Actinomycetes bacterium]